MQSVYNEAEIATNKIWYNRIKEWLYQLRQDNASFVEGQINQILIEAQNPENNGDSIPKQKDEFGGTSHE